MLGTPQELLAEGAQLQQDDPLRPFSIKHARQQASIVGHMQRVWASCPQHCPCCALARRDWKSLCIFTEPKKAALFAPHVEVCGCEHHRRVWHESC